MPRIRTIKPEFPHSQSMGRVSRDARLTFILLWTLADDSGRTRGSSRMLASLLFPYDDDAPKKISGWLDELQREGCIFIYTVDGCDYVEIRNWLSHQKIDKPSPSKLPPFANIREDSRLTRERSSLDLDLDQDQGIGPGEEQNPPVVPQGGRALSATEKPRRARKTSEAYPPEFERFWATYPPIRKQNKPGAAKAWARATEATAAEAILTAAEAFAASRLGRSEYCPGPEPWLNQRRWEDDRRSWDGARHAAAQVQPVADEELPF